MSAPISYFKGNLGAIDQLSVEMLLAEVPWESRVAARYEAFYSTLPAVSYTYGSGRGERTYYAHLRPSWLVPVWAEVEHRLGCFMEFCFLNRYDNERQSLGWHADDSPEMDPERPIAVVSYGATREILFRPKAELGPSDEAAPSVERWMLGDRSLLVMSAGMQQSWLHRIPKAPHKCGPRVSLTFRGMTP